MGKRYVMINELKPEHVQDYIDMHMNCPSSEIYKGQLDALKEAGAEECIVYMWKNYSILIVKTDDIDAYMKKLGETAHAYTPDSDKKYFAWIIKIYLIHNSTVLSVFISYLFLY